MIQTSIQPAALDRGRARRRWLPVTAACALLGFAGALLGSSCGGEEFRCFSDERCEPCPGHCLEDVLVDTFGAFGTHIVWVGEQGEEPTCEEYGLEHDGDWWLDLQDDPSCPPCRCERIDCASGGTGFKRSALDCEAARDAGGTSLHPPWGECEPLENRETSAVYTPWFDIRSACYSRNDLFQPGATWKRKARRCWARQPREYSCGSNPNVPTCLVDPRILSDGFRLCLTMTHGDDLPRPGHGVTDAACPSEFPEKLDMYAFVSGCGSCDCELDGEACSMEFSYYSDQACSDLVLTQTLTTESVCTELAEPVAIGGIKLRMLAEGHGDCIDHGRVGIAEGEKIEPRWGQTLCCKPLGS
ncbi:hypothetical protein [Sorangium sp. So ce128]|uniref:hypothetical protein n=1 Tax=Sorangium sp. So ce128 TaxID=3133281 RepID=UPI003F5DFA6F